MLASTSRFSAASAAQRSSRIQPATLSWRTSSASAKVEATDLSLAIKPIALAHAARHYCPGCDARGQAWRPTTGANSFLLLQVLQPSVPAG